MRYLAWLVFVMAVVSLVSMCVAYVAGNLATPIEFVNGDASFFELFNSMLRWAGVAFFFWLWDRLVRKPKTA